MPLAAFDEREPNARLKPGERVVATFRLYRIRRPPVTVSGDDPLGRLGEVLGTVERAIETARNFLGGIDGPNVGRRLEREFKFVLILQALHQIDEYRTHFGYTHGGYFIDTPFKRGKGVTRWHLAGQTHRMPVTVNGIPQDGDAALDEFKQLLDDYMSPREGTTPDFALYWLNPLAAATADDPFGEYEWLIHPVRDGLRISQTDRKPYTRKFSFDFYGLQNNRDLAKAEDGFLAGLQSNGLLRNLLNRLDLGAIADGAQLVFGTVDRVRGIIDDTTALAGQVRDYVSGVRDFIRFSFGKVRGLITSTRSLIGVIEEGINLAKDIPNLTADEFDRLRRTWPGLSNGDTTSGIILSDDTRRALDFLMALAINEQAFSPALRGPTLPQTIAVDIPPGLNIEAVAKRAGADVQQIIETNDLQFPFVDSRIRPERVELSAVNALSLAFQSSSDLAATGAAIVASTTSALAGIISQGEAIAPAPTVAKFRAAAATAQSFLDRVKLGGGGPTSEEVAILQAAADAATDVVLTNPSLPKVAYAGDQLRLPTDRRDEVPSIVGVVGSQLNAILAIHGSITEEERLFGIDILLNEEGDFEWDADRRDLKLSRGLDNIDRAQRRYVALPYGALNFAPGIGNYAFEDLGSWQGEEKNRFLAFSLHKTISQDPRVRRVRRTQAVSEGGIAHVVYDAELINGRELFDLRAPLELANAA